MGWIGFACERNLIYLVFKNNGVRIEMHDNRILDSMALNPLIDWLAIFRYQTLVQSQSRDLGLLRRQLEQSRMTTTKLRNIIEDLTRSDQTIDQRRYIQLARRTIRKLEGEFNLT